MHGVPIAKVYEVLVLFTFRTIVQSTSYIYMYYRGTGAEAQPCSDETNRPRRVAGIPLITAAAAGFEHSLFLDTERGEVYATGSNDGLFHVVG